MRKLCNCIDLQKMVAGASVFCYNDAINTEQEAILHVC